MSLSAQRQALIHWCDTERPQQIVGDKQFNVIHDGAVTPLHPIGETTQYSRHGYARILLLSSQELSHPYTPQEKDYTHVGLYYETMANGLQLQHARREVAKIEALRPRNTEAQSFQIPEIDAWEDAREEGAQEEQHWKTERTPWDEVEEENRKNTIWLGGRELDLRDLNEEKGDPIDRYETQRRAILEQARMNHHIEPLLLSIATATRVFLLLSDRPYSYPSMY